MTKPAILGALLVLVFAVWPPHPVPAADDKPAPADKAVPADLSKKFVIVGHTLGGEYNSALLKGVEHRKLGTREFLVGEYCINADAGVSKEWEGVQMWVPVDNIESLMVFADEKKAWTAVKENGKSKDEN
jgi:hypothetical protein